MPKFRSRRERPQGGQEPGLRRQGQYGVTRKVAADLRRLLEPLVVPKAQLSKPLRKKDAVWVTPSVKG